MDAQPTRRSAVLAALGIFWGCLLVYHANGRPHAGFDTVGAPYTAWAMVRHGSLDLHSYRELERFVGPTIFELSDGRWVSFRPPGIALAVVPVVAPLAAFREEPVGITAMHHLGKLAAAAHVAGAAVLFFFLCRRLVPAAAWPATVLFAFGTSLYSVASQASWQHGPATFWLTLALFLLTDFTKEMGVKRGLWVGLALGMAIMTRPPAAFFLAATGVAFLYQRRWRGIVGLTLGSAALLAVYCAFNFHYFGDVFRGGYARDHWDEPTPLWLGASGLLVAPSRGVLVYSPALMLLPWGLWLILTVGRVSTSPGLPGGLEIRPTVVAWLGASIATLLLFARWYDWRGGWCFGPRFLCETMPVCCLLFGYAYAGPSFRWLRGVAVALVCVSVYVHAIGIFGHAAETDWCMRHDRPDQGRCLFEWRDTQIEAYTAATVESLGRRLGFASESDANTAH
jgi:hypothetical protein